MARRKRKESVKRPSILGIRPPKLRHGPNPYALFRKKPKAKPRRVAAPKRKVAPLGGLFQHSPGFHRKTEGEKQAERLAKLQKQDREAELKRIRKLYPGAKR